MTFHIKTRPPRRPKRSMIEVNTVEVVLSLFFWIGTAILLAVSIFVALANLTFYV